MSQHDSIASVKRNRRKILSNITVSTDTCVDKISDIDAYSLRGYHFSYRHPRPLPKKTANKAMKYIRAICVKYPFQVRIMIASPLWERFAQEWCESGDELKSLKAI